MFLVTWWVDATSQNLSVQGGDSKGEMGVSLGFHECYPLSEWEGPGPPHAPIPAQAQGSQWGDSGWHLGSNPDLDEPLLTLQHRHSFENQNK